MKPNRLATSQHVAAGGNCQCGNRHQLRVGAVGVVCDRGDSTGFSLNSLVSV